MAMLTVFVRQELEVKTLEMWLPADEALNNDEADADVQRVVGEVYAKEHGEPGVLFRIDIDTGVIDGWADKIGEPLDIYGKPRDSGVYVLLNAEGKTVARREDYVPNGLVPGDDGDYVDLKIDSAGRITNWPAPDEIDLSAFEEDKAFEEDEDD